MSEQLTDSEHMLDEERLVLGKSRRKQVPRCSYAEWTPAPNRRDPLKLLQAQDKRRIPELLSIQYGRMLLSRFRPIDTALRIGGVGSVGTTCSILLLEGGSQGDAIILQQKEAGPSVLQTYLPPGGKSCLCWRPEMAGLDGEGHGPLHPPYGRALFRSFRA